MGRGSYLGGHTILYIRQPLTGRKRTNKKTAEKNKRDKRNKREELSGIEKNYFYMVIEAIKDCKPIPPIPPKWKRKVETTIIKNIVDLNSPKKEKSDLSSWLYGYYNSLKRKNKRKIIKRFENKFIELSFNHWIKYRCLTSEFPNCWPSFIIDEIKLSIEKSGGIIFWLESSELFKQHKININKNKDEANSNHINKNIDTPTESDEIQNKINLLNSEMEALSSQILKMQNQVNILMSLYDKKRAELTNLLKR